MIFFSGDVLLHEVKATDFCCSIVGCCYPIPMKNSLCIIDHFQLLLLDEPSYSLEEIVTLNGIFGLYLILTLLS
jgi:hypothetical protein